MDTPLLSGMWILHLASIPLIPLQPITIEDLRLKSNSLINIEPDSVEFDPLIVFKENLLTQV